MKEETKEKIKLWIKRYFVKLQNFWRRYRFNKLIILLGLCMILVGSSYLVFLAKTADVENLKSGLQETTIVYDRYKEEAGELYSQKGTFVPIDEISSNIQMAVVSTEDKRFFSHKGVDPIGIARAALGFVINRGNIVGGGSTITQQLAKNAYLSLDQTLIRKAKELFLSFEIEKQYEKDEILEMYLNNSYFGSGVWGVEDASKKYFGKSAAEVTMAEGAVLAAILKAPSYYNPLDHYEESIERRDLILQLMVDNEITDQESADQAMAEGIYLNDQYTNNRNYQYPSYFDAVIDEAIQVYGFEEEDIMNRGYKIYTGLDQEYQIQMDQTYEDAYFVDAEDGTLMQSASVAMDPETGDVLAIIGGRGEQVFRGFNRATQMSVPPGSTIKPLSVYTPALENGYDVDSMVIDDDTLTYGENNDYSVKNYDLYSSYEEKPLYQAVAESKNTVAAYLLDKIGIQKGISTLKKFGISVSPKDEVLGQVALGGMDGVSPLQMASAYGTFPNKGIRTEARFITKIIDSTGAVVVDNTEPKTTRVTTAEVSEKMTSMLMEVYAPGGTGYGAQPYNGMLVAGKTGTSELDAENTINRSKWMIAYTPDMVVATWIGFDETDETHNLNGIGMMFYNLFSAETGNLLSISPQTEFTVGGAAEISGQEGTTDGGWNNPINDFIQGVDDFGKRIEEGSKKIFDWARNVFN